MCYCFFALCIFDSCCRLHIMASATIICTNVARKFLGGVYTERNRGTWNDDKTTRRKQLKHETNPIHIHIFTHIFGTIFLCFFPALANDTNGEAHICRRIYYAYGLFLFGIFRRLFFADSDCYCFISCRPNILKDCPVFSVDIFSNGLVAFGASDERNFTE